MDNLQEKELEQVVGGVIPVLGAHVELESMLDGFNPVAAAALAEGKDGNEGERRKVQELI